ncbi:MAG: helix-turn-helix domain-containing protein [Ignavibacteriales bacterium]|nr:helix-turn-helix domain-containing protein [Ignavibacteriales bacterium]
MILQDSILTLSISDFEKIVEKTVQKVLIESKKNSEKEFLSSSELISWLGISLSTLAKWKKNHRIPYSRNGKRIFFKRSEVLGALKQNNFYKIKDLYN